MNDKKNLIKIFVFDPEVEWLDILFSMDDFEIRLYHCVCLHVKGFLGLIFD